MTVPDGLEEGIHQTFDPEPNTQGPFNAGATKTEVRRG